MKLPGPVVSRAQTPLATASAPKYRLKVALPARFPQGAERPTARQLPGTAFISIGKSRYLYR